MPVLLLPLLVLLPGLDAFAADPLDTWHLRTSQPTRHFEAITFGNDIFVAIARQGTIEGSAISSNGIEWISGAHGPAFFGVGYGEGLFVASSAALYTSVNGMEWANRGGAASGNLNDVALGNGIWVAVGGDSGIRRTARSTNGINWTWSLAGAPGLQSVVHGNGLFVAVGYDGRVVTSTAGSSWTTVSSGVTVGLRGIAYGNGQFVAVGETGTILTSPNGSSWTKRTSGTTRGLADIAYGNGTFVAVGAAGALLTSTNGSNWMSRVSPTTENLNGVTYGHGTFVAVGSGSAIVQSDSVIDRDGDLMPNDWELAYGFDPNDPSDALVDADGDGLTNLNEYRAGTNPTNQLSVLKLAMELTGPARDLVRFQFAAVSNKSYAVQTRASLDAGNWSNLLEIVARNTNRVEAVTNPFPAGAGAGYFRLVTPLPR